MDYFIKIFKLYLKGKIMTIRDCFFGFILQQTLNSHVLGNLPPLSGSRTLGLSPLKKIQPLSKPESKKESDPSPHASLDQTPDKNLSHPGRKELPNLGFGKDHVISEKENTSFSRDKVKVIF